MRRRRPRRALPSEFLRPPRRRAGEVGAPIPHRSTKVLLAVVFTIGLGLLHAIDPAADPVFSLGRFLAPLALWGGLVALLAGYYAQVERAFISRTSRVVLVLAASFLVLLSARLLTLVEGWPPYGIPVVLASLVWAICLGRRLAFELSLVLLAAASHLLAESTGAGRPLAEILLVLTPGCLVAILTGYRVRRRSTLIRIGLAVGVVQALALLAVRLPTAPLPLWSDLGLVIDLGWALFLGLVAGFLLTGFLPVVENLLGVTTDIRLLELSNLDHPLLQALSMRAPGTYHHSLLVGQLAEAAAEAIGADGLLCRVGAYYHDIGKIVRPGFFVENGFSYEDCHLRLSPGMSSLVILAHVKDGEELGRIHRLPEPILDVIRQHQGVGTVEFFYRRALEELGPRAVDRARFSYPGPRPQTPEVAIVALADSTEAAYRSLEDPSPGSVQKIVGQVIARKIEEGLLDEAPLTLRQLARIEESFVRVLQGIFHSRRLPRATPVVPAAVET